MGLFRSNSGLGQAARSSARALTSLGTEFCHIDTTDQYLSRNTSDSQLGGQPVGAFGEVNLIHANAAEFVGPLPIFSHRLGGRYNIAMWFWEGATLPEPWMPAFDRLDELWVASEYLVDVFGQYAKVPVHNVGMAADLPSRHRVSRSDVGLRDDEFVFLFVYDAQSVPYRKNPEKALEAFVRAFGPEFRDVRFVLKAHNLHKFPDSEQRLRAMAERYPAISIIESYLSRDSLLDLMAAADVYVSLHAAEGYGLTLLEAMSQGTPTLCTAYSGNMDFTTDANSWLVDYELTRLDRDAGPYPAGTAWASPSVDAAAALMRQARDNPTVLHRKSALAVADATAASSLDRYAANLDTELKRVLGH